MRILVVGADTVTGRHLIKYILESGHQARAILHNSVQAAYFQTLGVESFHLSEKPKMKELVNAAKDVEAICLIGSFLRTEKEPYIRIDEMIRYLELFNYVGVKRFVHMSTFESRKFLWNTQPAIFRSTIIENYYIDRWLKTSNVDFTILHPGTLIDQQGTGFVTISEHEINNRHIPREDVAKAMLMCLENDATIGKEFKITSGKTTIAEALTFYNK
ncbi:NAD(P)H-binding protein [Lysinibacillus antri]|uniref:NAD(P)-binding domain-containing protein n=1 Tax=Lysinibacillus antri TaxID=2498145 RepID=A0A432LBW0_9BACI|nr:NAD(P)H-binding protein [Lysinibacillus antri]RUL52244.1 hypothetical protein EK386_10355 [Lysinibacillus antri]